MNRQLLFGLLAGAAAWLIASNNINVSRRKISADEAAAKLKQGWADYHTTA